MYSTNLAGLSDRGTSGPFDGALISDRHIHFDSEGSQADDGHTGDRVDCSAASAADVSAADRASAASTDILMPRQYRAGTGQRSAATGNGQNSGIHGSEDGSEDGLEDGFEGSIEDSSTGRHGDNNGTAGGRRGHGGASSDNNRHIGVHVEQTFEAAAAGNDGTDGPQAQTPPASSFSAGARQGAAVHPAPHDQMPAAGTGGNGRGGSGNVRDRVNTTKLLAMVGVDALISSAGVPSDAQLAQLFAAPQVLLHRFSSVALQFFCLLLLECLFADRYLEAHLPLIEVCVD